MRAQISEDVRSSNRLPSIGDEPGDILVKNFWSDPEETSGCWVIRIGFVQLQQINP